ncbi:rhomboid family intramembrane serine protease [Roseivirga misakiensis]|uniref:Peptidase S54 rhomboid domain-containing protein n=1 Tax=Roseivirga misakiensis TaxID=1563681 RepID=A0A1E5T5L2_9BACT|nr:rhomboid family intramembrane serine protease [Roseivirga misakiensis]OEK06672.1 hypothetical protein BFP71_03125 [Roseivirga misakiensis]
MFGRITPIVKNLLIINVAIFLVPTFLNMDLGRVFGLYFIYSENFKPVQFVTYMFLHGSNMHLLGNMLLLFLAGPMLEYSLGSKKFLILYMVTGLGGGILYTAANYAEMSAIKNDVDRYISAPNSQSFNELMVAHSDNVYNQNIYLFTDQYSRNENNPELISRSIGYARGLYAYFGNYPMVGASGAVYGILAMLGLLFPNRQVMLLILPPIKIKYIVGFLIIGEIFAEFQRTPGDNVAHLAHLGGALFAWGLLRYWQKKGGVFS